MINNWEMFLESKNRKKSAVCLVEFNNKILLLERSKEDKIQGWCLPGGKIDKGETKLEGVIREVIEETGIKITNPSYLGESKSTSGRIVYVYHIIVNSDDVKLSKEHKSYKWVNPNSIPVTLAGNTKEFIKLRF
jgi:8-oxo-dGTP pyrophosphatase MutT (NUDIX family)